MKYNYRKLFISILMITSVVFCLSLNCFAHSGRTDSSGGHKDNKNKSGLGSYHYHCGGHPPHLHTNGVCPYSSNSGSSYGSSSSKSSSSYSSTKSTSTTTSNNSTKTSTQNKVKESKVLATGIKISKTISSIKVGDTKYLSADISPNNVTDNSVTWSSSNESIATISSSGKLQAKKSGTVIITAATSNNKSDSIEIKIEEEQKKNEKIVSGTKQYTANENNMNNNSVSNNNLENPNPMAGILTVGILGGGSYWGYKNIRKNKE